MSKTDTCVRCGQDGHTSSSCKQPCAECVTAQAKPHHGTFLADCIECKARMLAHGPAAFYSAKEGRLTDELKTAVRATFGDDWKAGLERVKHWAGRIGGAV